jgi:hypothetical protein
LIKDLPDDRLSVLEKEVKGPDTFDLGSERTQRMAAALGLADESDAVAILSTLVDCS